MRTCGTCPSPCTRSPSSQLTGATFELQRHRPIPRDHEMNVSRQGRHGLYGRGESVPWAW
jgi:hypothetical protein